MVDVTHPPIGSMVPSALVADVCHDLQSPLIGLRAELEVARAAPESVDVAALAKRLLAAGAEMETLVADLLAWAVGHELSDEHLPRRLDLGDLVREEVEQLRPLAAEVVLDATCVDRLHVVGDAPALRRLVRNLVDNALRHAERSVRVSLTEDHGRCILDVVDDGAGVAPADRQRIFERFTTGTGGGTGLGLSIVRLVARHHGGDVRLLDTLVGAHFRVCLPIAAD